MAEKSPRGPRRWFDPRLAIGLALVVVSVVGVVFVVSEADRTTLVYAASTTLAVGDDVRLSDFTPVPVRLGAATTGYVVAGELRDDRFVMTRDVAEGELVPAAAFAAEADTGRTRVVLSVAGPLAESVETGALVDVWAAEAQDHDRFGTPSVILPAARVIRLVEAEGIMSDGRTVSVELQIAKDRTATVLEAQARQDALTVLPTASGVQ